MKKQSKAEKIRVFLAEGVSVKDIAKKLKIAEPYVAQVKWHWKKKAQQPKAKKVKLPVSKPEEEKDIESYWGRLPASEETQALDDLVNRFLGTRDKELDDRDAQQIDWVNSPSHYKVGGIETIEFIEAKGLGYNLGNVVKYITRADHKGNREQDLNKALWYLTREIQKYSEV